MIGGGSGFGFGGGSAGLARPGVGTPANALAFQLDTGHYEPRVTPMHVVHPRPDADTGSGYVYRNAYPGMQWRLPVAVQGGSWPFRYEITDAGGSGVTIGEQHGDTDYGIMSWDNPSAGSYEITVRVRDQEYERGGGSESDVTVTFTLVVGTSNFAFFDAVNGDNSTGDGSIGSPYADFGAWDDGDGRGSVGGMVCVYRTGTYTIDQTADIFLDGDRYFFGHNGFDDPSVHMAHPDDSDVIFDFTNGYWLMTADFALVGMKFVGVGNTDEQYARGSSDRFLAFDVDFTVGAEGVQDPGAGTNSSMVMAINSGSSGDYQDWAVSHCRFTDLTGYDFFLIYSLHHAVFEGNVIENYTSSGDGWGVFVKDTVPQYITTRNNRTVGTINGVLSRIDEDSRSEAGGRTNEVCWNYWRASSTSMHTQLVEDEWGYISYRNTWHCDGVPVDVQSHATDPHGVEHVRDVIVHDGTETDGIEIRGSGSVDVTKTDLLTGVPADGILDSEGKLQGSYRTNFLGERGHEVA